MRTVISLVVCSLAAQLGSCTGYVNLGDPLQGVGSSSDGEDPEPMGGKGGASLSSGGSGSSSGGGTLGGTSAAGSGAVGGAEEPEETGGASTSSGGSDAAGSASTGGTPATGGSAGEGSVPARPFKILILSTTLEFHHDSIPACQEMVADLGKLDANNQWTTQVETDDLVDFTDAGLKPFGMLFWCSPTGTVFSNNAKVKDKAVAMKALQTYVEGGGAWGGVHSATDFEKSNGFPWFTNTLVGAYFVDHDADGTAGTVQIQSMFATHPVMKGLSTTYPTQDEWYRMNRDVSAQPGFQILARLASDNRPLVWVKDVGSGRMFYTVRGHNKSVYAEKEFRTVVQNGILWATRRVN